MRSMRKKNIHSSNIMYIDIFPLDTYNFNYSITINYDFGLIIIELFQIYIFRASNLALCLLLILFLVQVPYFTINIINHNNLCRIRNQRRKIKQYSLLL